MSATIIPTTAATTSTPSAAASDLTRNPGINPVSKHVLDGVFGVAAVMLIIALCMWRTSQLQRAKRPYSEFFPDPRSSARRRRSHTPRDPYTVSCPNTPMFPASTSSSRHAQRDGRRSARGADIDEAGRRGSFTSDDKEGLPAYDGRGSPPKYVDLEMGPHVPVPEMAHIRSSFARDDASPYVTQNIELTPNPLSNSPLSTQHYSQ